MFTVDDYFRSLEPYLPEDLVSSECLTGIRAVAALLPGALTDIFGFDCQLGVESDQVHFLFCVRPTGAGRDVLAGRCESTDLPRPFTQHPVWRQLGEFCGAWADPARIFHDKVTELWLELDMDEPRPAVPAPNMFVGSKCIRLDFESHEWLTRQALPELTGFPVPQPVECKLLDCIQRLPRGADIFQVGAMLAREPAFVRICVRGLSPDRITTYLTDIDWPGDEHEIAALVTDLTGLADWVCVDVDVSDRIGPKVGIECYCGSKSAPRLIRHYDRLLEWLVQKGLCLPKQQDALVAFSGIANERDDASRWPESLSAASSLMGPGHVSIMTRELSHVKVVYQQGRPLAAKAYPGVRYVCVPIEQKGRDRAQQQRSSTK